MEFFIFITHNSIKLSSIHHLDIVTPDAPLMRLDG